MPDFSIFALAFRDMNLGQQAWFIFSEYYEWFFRGAGFTLLIAISGTIAGSILGLLIGIIRTIPVTARDGWGKKALLKVINAILVGYIEFFRGTPMMIQAVVIFYGVAIVTGNAMHIIFAGFIIVAINTGSYMAEIVRGGIISIDKGQFEAAHSIGMTHWQTMINIILPQVMRNILPATGNEFVINIKDTSVLSVIGVTELFYMSKSVSGSMFIYFQVFAIACIFYLVMTLTVTRLLRLLERKLEGSGTYTIHGSHTLNETEIKVGDNAYGHH